MRCHREIEKQNSKDGVYISGVFEYTYQDSEENGDPSENAQQIHEESTQNSEENEETSQDEQQVHEESTQNSEENEETSQDEHLMATKPQAHQTHWKKKVRTKFYIKNIDEML